MYIKIKVTTEGKKEKLIKKSDDHFDVTVKERAKGNEANRRIKEILMEYFGTKAIRLISGHHSPSKIFSIED